MPIRSLAEEFFELEEEFKVLRSESKPWNDHKKETKYLHDLHSAGRLESKLNECIDLLNRAFESNALGEKTLNADITRAIREFENRKNAIEDLSASQGEPEKARIAKDVLEEISKAFIPLRINHWFTIHGMEDREDVPDETVQPKESDRFLHSVGVDVDLLRDLKNVNLKMRELQA